MLSKYLMFDFTFFALFHNHHLAVLPGISTAHSLIPPNAVHCHVLKHHLLATCRYDTFHPSIGTRRPMQLMKMNDYLLFDTENLYLYF